MNDAKALARQLSGGVSCRLMNQDFPLLEADRPCGLPVMTGESDPKLLSRQVFKLQCYAAQLHSPLPRASIQPPFGAPVQRDAMVQILNMVGVLVSLSARDGS